MLPLAWNLGWQSPFFEGVSSGKCIPHRSSFVVCAADVLHHCAASTLLLGSVGIFAFVNLVKSVSIGEQSLLTRHGILTVPHLLGTMKSLGSLSVNAIRLRNVRKMFHTCNTGPTGDVDMDRVRTRERPRTRVSSCGSGPPADAG